MIPRLIIAGCVAPGLVTWLAWPQLTWPVVKAKITKEFFSVRNVGTADLAKELDSEQQPVLLDMRTAAEFDVSHLPGAQRVAPEAEASELKLAKDAPIVTYCSVEGSIFQWANEGRLVADSRGRATIVHPYDRKRGTLLDESRRANVPDAK